jgi:hypothetical protein
MNSYADNLYSPRKEINEDNLNFLNEEVSHLEEELRVNTNNYKPSLKKSFNNDGKNKLKNI